MFVSPMLLNTYRLTSFRSVTLFSGLVAQIRHSDHIPYRICLSAHMTLISQTDLPGHVTSL